MPQVPMFDQTVPPDTESVKLGAQRIRTLTTALNTALANIFNGSGNDDGTLDSIHPWVDGWFRAAGPTGGLVLSADTDGRSNMANGFLELAHIAVGIYTADAPGRAPFDAGFVSTTLCATGMLSADTYGRALMAAGYFDVPNRDVVADGFITAQMINPGVIQQVKDAVNFSTTVTSVPISNSTFATGHISTTTSHGLTIGTVQPVMVTNASGDGSPAGNLTTGVAYFFVPDSTTSGYLYTTRALAVAGGQTGPGVNAGTLTTVTLAWVTASVNTAADVTPIMNGSVQATGFRVTFATPFGSPTGYTALMSIFRGSASIADNGHGVALANQQGASIDLVGVAWNSAIFSAGYIYGLSLAVF